MSGFIPKNKWQEAADALRNAEEKEFGPYRKREKEAAMITIRIRGQFRNALNEMACQKKTSINTLVRQFLMDTYKKWKEEQRGPTK